MMDHSATNKSNQHFYGTQRPVLFDHPWAASNASDGIDRRKVCGTTQSARRYGELQKILSQQHD
jgi:hypothetical protein